MKIKSISFQKKIILEFISQKGKDKYVRMLRAKAKKNIKSKVYLF